MKRFAEIVQRSAETRSSKEAVSVHLHGGCFLTVEGEAGFSVLLPAAASRLDE